MMEHLKPGTESQARSRYRELKKMLDERRREIQAEVKGKMRGVRSEGAWGGKQNEVLDAVESSEADIQGDIAVLREVTDRLGASVLRHFEVILRKRRDEFPFIVAHGEIE